MFVVALFGPAGVVIMGYGEVTINVMAMLWVYYSWGGPPILHPFIIVQTFPFTGFRLWLAYEMMRLYRRRVRIRRVKWAAVASETPFTLIGVISLMPLILYPSIYYVSITAPTLVLPLLSWVLLRVIPPPKEPDIWEGLPESVPWWETTDMPEQPGTN